MLKIQEVYKLSATAMQMMIKEVNDLVGDVVKDFSKRVISVEPAATTAVYSASTSYNNIFDGLDSEYRFRKYIRNNLDFVVSYLFIINVHVCIVCKYRNQPR